MSNKENLLKDLSEHEEKLAKIIIAGECEYCPLCDTCTSNVVSDDVCLEPLLEWLNKRAC